MPTDYLHRPNGGARKEMGRATPKSPRPWLDSVVAAASEVSIALRPHVFDTKPAPTNTPAVRRQPSGWAVPVVLASRPGDVGLTVEDGTPGASPRGIQGREARMVGCGPQPVRHSRTHPLAARGGGRGRDCLWLLFSGKRGRYAASKPSEAGNLGVCAKHAKQPDGYRSNSLGTTAKDRHGVQVPPPANHLRIRRRLSLPVSQDRYRNRRRLPHRAG